mmetsp:Transcript_48586/g.109118  ORF Transcript_48586/g.109118 Transcript_48586/m.109118 type:complete len:157 (+) Transcript_48586:3-473(+)
MIREPNVVNKLSLLGLRMDEAEELFQVLDADGSGEVSAEELIDGIQQLKGPALGQDMVRLISIAQKENWRAGCFVQRLRGMNAVADQIQARMNEMGRRLIFERSFQKSTDLRCEKLHAEAADRHMVVCEIDHRRSADYLAIAPKDGQDPAPDNFLE